MQAPRGRFPVSGVVDDDDGGHDECNFEQQLVDDVRRLLVHCL